MVAAVSVSLSVRDRSANPEGEIQSSLCDSPWQRKSAAPIEGAAGVAAARGEGKLRAAMGKFVRQPRGDTRVTPEDKSRAVAQRAAEIAERRAVFDANNDNN